jgi:gliding motility-associated lipoprotein GldH
LKKNLLAYLTAHRPQLTAPLATLLAACSLQLAACTSLPSDVFEKNVTIPGQAWASSFKPRIDFTIQAKDTADRYNVYVVLRHSDAYQYNNIWIQGTIRKPGDTIGKSLRADLPLADNNGWKGSGMDDIYEHRVLVRDLALTGFSKPGTYSFTLQQIMRDDPLPHVLNVGVRLEKVQ